MTRIIIKFKEGQKQTWHLVSIQDLSIELKLSMTVHLQYLIDKIAVCENEGASVGSIQGIRYLNDCYKAA